MIDISTLSTLLSFSDAELLRDMVGSVIASPHIIGFLRQKPALETRIREQLGEWQRGLSSQIGHQPVPDALEQEFLAYQTFKQWPAHQFSEAGPRLREALANSPFYDAACHLLEHLQESNPHLHKQLFLDKWREDMLSRLMSLEIALADEERERMLQELTSRLRDAGTVEETLHPEHPGQLWDLTATRLLPADSQRLHYYARFLLRNPQLRQIAEQLGRARAGDTAVTGQLTPVAMPVTEYKPLDQVPDDLVGVHHSNALNRLLPSETLLLTSPELETQFYRQFAERRLLNYHFMGVQPTGVTELVDQPSQGITPQPKGPFIVCIDTSGSMSGYPEQAAKGFCFALLQIALAEGRQCIIKLFSTDVVSYAVTGPAGLQEAVQFLGSSFHGGTDLAPCMGSVLDDMQQRDFREADAIVLSDFIAQRLPTPLLAQVQDLKQQGNRFHAICLSRHGKPALMKIFDEVWMFDTGLRGRLLRKLR